MKNQGGPRPRKGACPIAGQIEAAFRAVRGGPAPTGEWLSRAELEELVAEALEEALEEVEEKDLKDVKDSKD